MNLLNYATGINTIKESQLSLSLKNYNAEEAMQMALLHNPTIAIAKDKVNSQSYDSLQNYIEEYKSVIESLTNTINI